MSTPKLISPLLDNFLMGEPISEHDGVRCCPAVDQQTQEKYIVKIISIPASQTKLDALLLTGAYPDAQAACKYFKEQADDIVSELAELKQLSKMGGFEAFAGCQIVPMEDGTGYDVYLLSHYKKALDKHLTANPATHLDASNLALDICAALVTCRNAGHIYLDLKPSNIYVSPEKGYKIGDLGLMRTSSLKYAAIPQRFIGDYSAPELKDAFSEPNETVDTYALGMILYEIYNAGLPTVEADLSEPLPAPKYADEELCQIILKACHPDPSQRWQDPAQMGQALVSYIQRNGVSNEPIVPPMPVSAAEPELDISEDTHDSASDDMQAPDAQSPEETPEQDSQPLDLMDEIADNIDAVIAAEEAELQCEEEAPEEETAEDTHEPLAEVELISSEPAPEQTPEETFENLNFLDDPEIPVIPAEKLSDLDADTVQDALDEGISDDTAAVLAQADAVLTDISSDSENTDETFEEEMLNREDLHAMDDEACEDITTTVDEEASVDDTVECVDEYDATTSETAEISDEEDTAVFTGEASDAEEQPKKKRSKAWIGWVLSAVLLIGLLVGGYFFYTMYYLQPVNDLTFTGSKDTLSIQVSCPLDSSEISIVLTDKFGEKITIPLTEGNTTISGLKPDMTYSIEVVANGFHKLTGQTSATYNTQKLTEVMNLTVVTGNADGTANLSFQVNGPDSTSWTATLTDGSGNQITVPVQEHAATIKDLTVGTVYTVTVTPEEVLFLSGTTETEFTASAVYQAEKLAITSFQDEKLSVSWIAPEGANIAQWTVVCADSNGKQQVQTVTDTSAIFENIDHTLSYTVTVTADGQSVSGRTTIEAGAPTLSNLTATSAASGSVAVKWDAPAGDWIVICQLVDSSVSTTVKCTGNSVTIPNLIPGETYQIIVQTADEVVAAHTYTTVTVMKSGDFSGYTVNRWNMQFRMCKTPGKANWSRSDIADSDYTTSFAKGQKASFLIRMNKTYNTSPDTIVSVFVVRDQDGNVIHTSSSSSSWTNMWYQGYCELDIPGVETLAAGKYNMTVYFNGATAFTGDFAVTE